MIYILAPFVLAFALFALYLIVSLFLKDPARPFRMFGAPPLDDSPESTLRQAQDGEVQSSEEEQEDESKKEQVH